VTSVAKQSETAAQSGGSENVASEIQLPAYQNESLRPLATVTSHV